MNKYIRVGVICKCGHRKGVHSLVKRGKKYSSHALYPYHTRYNHMCRHCECKSFEEAKKCNKN